MKNPRRIKGAAGKRFPAAPFVFMRAMFFGLIRNGAAKKIFNANVE